MPSNFPIIKTNRLLLRQFEPTDIDNVFKGLSHPEVIKYYGVSFTSQEATRAQMQFFSDLEKNETGIWWAICNSNNSIFFGACGLNDLRKEHRKAEIGFWLLPEYWGQGIITEVVPLVCDYGYKHLNLHRIEAIVETENTNSRNVLSKLHFTHEGTLKDCEIKKGKFISLDVYAKINSD